MFRQLARALPKGARFTPHNGRLAALNTRIFSTKDTAVTTADTTDFWESTRMPTEADRSDWWSIGAQVKSLRARNKAAKKDVYPADYVNPSDEIVVGPDGNDGSLSHFVRKYGTHPFIGLGVLTMLSKEMIMFDEEFLLMFVWGGFVTLSWINLSAPVGKYLDDQIEARSKQFDHAFDAMIMGAEIHKSKMAWHIDLVPIMEEQQKDFKHMLEVSATAKNLEVRNAANASMLDKLTKIHTAEKFAFDKANADVMEQVYTGVWADFRALDAKTKATLLDTAIDNVGKVSKDLGEADPVKMAFNKWIRKVDTGKK